MINNKLGRVLLILLLTLGLGQEGITASSHLYFYNPESNLNDFRSLKTGFDSYLSSAKSAYQFQPFDNQETFEQFLKTHKNDVFFMPSWYYQDLVKQGDINLQPILVGTLNGEFTYTKVLSTKKNIKNIGELQGKRIASAANQDYTKKMLENMAEQQKLKLNKAFKMLTVPKDIDALMSVLFGMAQGALTARTSLTTLATLNPRKYRLLHQQAESQAIMLPLVVVYKPIKKSTTKQLLNVIENMPNSPIGREILGMLGLDGWKKISQ